MVEKNQMYQKMSVNNQLVSTVIWFVSKIGNKYRFHIELIQNEKG